MSRVELACGSVKSKASHITSSLDLGSARLACGYVVANPSRDTPLQPRPMPQHNSPPPLATMPHAACDAPCKGERREREKGKRRSEKIEQ
ncbi:hypothetical protein GUJ93_ZPchr0008g13978 [Zizania palustris]|uniref:Uncharacterized protein n=1 Tax=Zizania palustris TaxID=103762 RepID=A0A8J5UXA8_ZIZPA|nr:hypothetical protein GUJ93_ZPchr0008g13978 [Zizania palustris]